MMKEETAKTVKKARSLSEFTFEEIRLEYKKRKQERKMLRDQRRLRKICCSNCAHCFCGRGNPKNINDKTWVCSLKPTEYTGPSNGFGAIGWKVFEKCERPNSNSCDNFVNRNSIEGERIIKKRLDESDNFEFEGF